MAVCIMYQHTSVLVIFWPFLRSFLCTNVLVWLVIFWPIFRYQHTSAGAVCNILAACPDFCVPF